VDADDRALITRIRAANLTYLSAKRLESLLTTCRAIEAARLPGSFIEVGCALGGSAILIATAKKRERPFFIYDVFGAIPPPTQQDAQEAHARYRIIAAGQATGIGGDKYYGYRDELQEEVQANFNRFDIHCAEHSIGLVKGLIQQTLTVEHAVAFAHVDVDWHEPVSLCLTRIFPNLVLGGSIILDDYYDWAGCRMAADAYLRGVAGQCTLDDRMGSLKITRIKAAREEGRP
jgi:asparagine synthase (glutamine-hydrolysing)